VLTGIIGARRAWTVSMISALSLPWRIDRGDAEVAVAELALKYDERHAPVRHLDGARVAELVGRKVDLTLFGGHVGAGLRSLLPDHL
jgi:hypothetical protein